MAQAHRDSFRKKQARLNSPAYQTYNRIRSSWLVNILFSVGIPFLTLLTTEWIARGRLLADENTVGFWAAFTSHLPSFLVAYLLLLAVYVLVLCLSSSHSAATALVGLLGNVPAVVTYYKLILRKEPFLPWDLTQVGELVGVSDSITLDIQPNMIITLALFILLAVAGGFLRLPRENGTKPRLRVRLLGGAVSAGCGCLILFGIMLSPAGSEAIGIQADSWMQDRYYRNHGVITGFLTNLQLLDIEKPDGYSAVAVNDIVQQTQRNTQDREPYYQDSYAATTDETVQQPNIIYLMAESFWDVTALEGVEYDQEILPNLMRLLQEGAYGYCYSPSFGGGTCDVEFEALTGLSLEFLPAGSKPYQQYLTEETFSLAWWLKQDGYDTLAIHGYGARFWSRNTAYPNLGIDEFIASDSFENPERKRGFISDNAMVDRIIQEFEQHTDNPVFIHAVTMQNHTTYSRDRYPENELVNVVAAPEGISDSVIGQLEDCATGIRDMDAALGKLCDYLNSIDEPTIVVFWGDHLNPMSDGFSLFEETGFITKGDTASPELHKTPLLVWSNYENNQVDLGTIAAYNIGPVLFDMYGLEQPLHWEYLMQQLPTLHARTGGITVNPDDSSTEELTEDQAQAVYGHSLLQYDLMFGNGFSGIEDGLWPTG